MEDMRLEVIPALPASGCGRFVRGRARKAGCAPVASLHLTDEENEKWPELPVWLEATRIVACMDACWDVAAGVCKKVFGLGGIEGAASFLFGGTDLAHRIIKGTLVAGLRRPELSLAQVLDSKNAMNRKLVAFLQQEFAKGAREGSTFFYICVQPLGGAWRAQLLLLFDSDSAGVVRCHGIQPPAAAKAKTPTHGTLVEYAADNLLDRLRELLSSPDNGTAAVSEERQKAFEALFNCRLPPTRGATLLTATAQSQTYAREAVTRRWWKLCKWTGREPEIFRQAVLRFSRKSPPVKVEPPVEFEEEEGRQVLGKMYGTEAFSLESYKRMRDDVERTGKYKKAIDRVCGGKVVLEIGTGPFALLALFAARAGASRVYAVEAEPPVAVLAEQHVREAGLAHIVTVITGISTEVELPELADVVIHELIGVLATEEGVVEALHDASLRLLKPDFVSVPHAVRTKGALFPKTIGDTPVPEPQNKCGCCGGGWSLGVGLHVDRHALTAPATIEDAVFDRASLLESSNQQRLVRFPARPDKAALKAGCLGLWVELELLPADSLPLGAQREEYTVSSLADSSCWPKCVVAFAHEAPALEAAGEVFYVLKFSAEAAHPMRYEFNLSHTLQQTPAPVSFPPVVLHNVADDPLQVWLSGVREGVLLKPRSHLDQKHELRATHVDGLPVQSAAKASLCCKANSVVTVVRCYLSNALSPLHVALLENDAEEANRLTNSDAARWSVRDALWGLSAAHFQVLLGKRVPGLSDFSVKDSNLNGTPLQWSRLLSEPDGATEQDAACCLAEMEDGRIASIGRETFEKLTRRKYLDHDVAGRDFVVEVLLRLKPRSDLPFSEDVVAAGDSNVYLSRPLRVHASRSFEAGDFVCRVHGRVTTLFHVPGESLLPASDANYHPLPQGINYFLDTSAYCSPGALISTRAESPNCERSVAVFGACLTLIVVAKRSICRDEELTLLHCAP
ncbi:Histone-arginine methyltransferase CARMER [Diplonema papillatum]|nr:Histone-arginine methyltransferase CARMER [Diplonema papillatum]